MKQFYCTGLGSLPYDLKYIQEVFPRSAKVVTRLGVGQCATDADGDTWFRAPDKVGAEQIHVEHLPGETVGYVPADRLERIATAALQGLIASGLPINEGPAALRAIVYAKALIVELDKQA